MLWIEHQIHNTYVKTTDVINMGKFVGMYVKSVQLRHVTQYRDVEMTNIIMINRKEF